MKQKIAIIIIAALSPYWIYCQESSTCSHKIGIMVAMKKESDLLKNYFQDSLVVVMVCGIGKVNAAWSCTEMIQRYRPAAIISMGCAGGNGNNIHVGDVVVSKEQVYHDVYCGNDVNYGQIQGMPSHFKSDSTLLTKAMQLNEKVIPGLIATGDWFVDSKEKMEEIAKHFPTVKAVDMESAAIAQVCNIFQVPFISFRIVSDMPLADKHASQYQHFWENSSKKTFSIAKDYIKLLTNK